MRGAFGEKLALRIWRGKKGLPVILYLHGIEGHGEWFAHTAAFLNECGLTVYVPDRRGAGMNESARGHLSSYRDFLSDIEILLGRINQDHPGDQVVLFGNCWGAKAAAVLANSRYKTTDGKKLPALSGLILTCPALFTRVDFNFPTKARIA
jgi:alpha-beta hydrolase superfamily lysophospholipase